MWLTHVSAVGLQISEVRKGYASLFSSPVKWTVDLIYFQDKCQWGDNFYTYQKFREVLHITFLFLLKVAKVRGLQIAEKSSHQKLPYSSFAFISTQICEFSYRLCKYSHFDCCELSGHVCVCVLHWNGNCVPLSSWCTWNSWVQYALGLRLEVIMKSKKLYI